MKSKATSRAIEVRKHIGGMLRASRLAFSRLRGLSTRSGPQPQRMAAWERTEEGWNVVEGEVGGPALRILRARVIEDPSGPPALRAGGGIVTAKEAILVVSSRRFVCREIELPALSADELQRMLALRLETELPYALSEATWAFEHRGAAPRQETANVLLVAIPSEDIAADEHELREAGQTCQVVESSEVSLAQAAVALAPDAQTVAIVAVESTIATAVVVHQGNMTYARSLTNVSAGESGGPAWNEAGMSRLANELDQSLQHYVRRSGRRPPEKLLVVGHPALAVGLVDALAERTSLPVEVPDAPQELGFAEADVDPKEAFIRFASCVGALVATQRRLCDQRTAAPALRVSGRRRAEPALFRVVGLAALIAVLLVAVVASAFGLRGARLHAATVAVAEANSVLRQAELLEEEVGILRHENERRRSTLDLLLALTEALPKGVMVKDLTIDPKGKVTIHGRAPSVEAASKAVAALVDSGSFANAQLGRSEHEREGFMFQITCVVR